MYLPNWQEEDILCPLCLGETETTKERIDLYYDGETVPDELWAAVEYTRERWNVY